jgi:hypothetical protein
MFKQTLLMLVSAFALIGNTPDGDIPLALVPYIIDGELKTDDFGWMRGAFDGATEKQKADWQMLSEWLGTCGVADRNVIIAKLAAMGVQTELKESGMTGSAVCVAVQPFQFLKGQTKSWDEFSANEAKAREVFQIYQYGAKIAAQNMPYEKAWGSGDTWDLLARTVFEQVYRRGFSWQSDTKAPKLDPAIIPYLNAHFQNAVYGEDSKNTAFLKNYVAEKGWPTISKVGERASGNAWLLVQHADHDPAFQLKALRLMEPLAAKGEVSKANYAYLYDRIMLKLSGKQRFGTQLSGCEGSEYKLRPLENEKQLTELRLQYELKPISEYRKSMKDNFGPCRTG